VAATKVFFEDVETGDKIPELVKKPITETQLVMYAGASGDFNPMHTVHKFGERAGFGGVIAHGMLGMAFAGQLITDWLGVDAMTKFSVRFVGITKPKDIITCNGKITKKYSNGGKNYINCDLVSVNQNGDTVVTGSATAVLPNK